MKLYKNQLLGTENLNFDKESSKKGLNIVGISMANKLDLLTNYWWFLPNFKRNGNALILVWSSEITLKSVIGSGSVDKDSSPCAAMIKSYTNSHFTEVH